MFATSCVTSGVPMLGKADKSLEWTSNCAGIEVLTYQVDQAGAVHQAYGMQACQPVSSIWYPHLPSSVRLLNIPTKLISNENPKGRGKAMLTWVRPRTHQTLFFSGEKTKLDVLSELDARRADRACNREDGGGTWAVIVSSWSSRILFI